MCIHSTRWFLHFLFCIWMPFGWDFQRFRNKQPTTLKAILKLLKVEFSNHHNISSVNGRLHFQKVITFRKVNYVRFSADLLSLTKFNLKKIHTFLQNTNHGTSNYLGAFPATVLCPPDPSLMTYITVLCFIHVYRQIIITLFQNSAFQIVMDTNKMSWTQIKKSPDVAAVTCSKNAIYNNACWCIPFPFKIFVVCGAYVFKHTELRMSLWFRVPFFAKAFLHFSLANDFRLAYIIILGR